MTRLPRRRFLTICACAALAGSARSAPQQRLTWQGVAFGADVSIMLDGPDEVTRPALARARLEIEAYEARFSLFRADSDLVALNAAGQLRDLDARWREMLTLGDRLYRATGGLFDPTIQSLWQAHALGRDLRDAADRTGWDRVRLPDAQHRGVVLGDGQALSFNGVAQGAATDAVRAVLRQAGLTRVLVDIGEMGTLGGPWRIGMGDPAHGTVATLRLSDSALAVSSPAALQMPGGIHHILDPRGERSPHWSSVGVVAASAALADGLSTAACLMSRAELLDCAARLDGVTQVILVDHAGKTDISEISYKI